MEYQLLVLEKELQAVASLKNFSVLLVILPCRKKQTVKCSNLLTISNFSRSVNEGGSCFTLFPWYHLKCVNKHSQTHVTSNNVALSH